LKKTLVSAPNLANAGNPKVGKRSAQSRAEPAFPLAFQNSAVRSSHTLEFRPIAPLDREFLKQLYGTTREHELAQTTWSEAEKTAFIEAQFQAQHSYYQQHFCAANFMLVTADRNPIGRIYLDRRKHELRLIDIALLPAWRGRGLGTQLLLELIEEARARGLPIRIHVERFNPAMRLYLRLGFTPVEDLQVYQLMEWRPDSPAD